MSFKRLWKIVSEVIVLSSDGSAFQALGAATMNALSAVRVLVLGMTKSPRLVERNRYFRTLRDRCRRLRVTTSCASSKQACAVDVVKEQLQAIVCTAYLATSVWLVDELTFCVGTSVDNAFRAPTNTSSCRSLHEISKWPKMQFQSIEFLWLNNYFRFWLPCWFLSILQAFNENIT